MDPIQSGSNPTNNPRLDLLHNTGSNQQLNGAAGSYGPAPTSAAAFHEKPITPSVPAKPEKPAASYIAAAQSKRPASPVPLPDPPPQPRPAPTPTPPPPDSSGSSGHPLIIGLVVVIILAAVGVGGWLWWSHRAKPAPKPAPITVTPVAPTNLSQEDSTNAAIDLGGTTKQGTITFEFNVDTKANSGSLTPEVEIEPAATAFTGQAAVTGGAVSANGGTMQFRVSSSTLKNGSYHWQARVSQGGQHSSWVVFGSNLTATAFTVSTVAPTAPTVSTVGGVGVANPTVVTSNLPVIAGSAGAGDTITITVSPDTQKFTTTADSSGNWTVTPSANIPNGLHQLSIVATDTAGVASTATQVALSVNPATAADTTPSPAATAPATTTPATAPATAAAAPAKNLAGTGDNTTAVSLLSLAVMIMAAVGIAMMRRRYATF